MKKLIPIPIPIAIIIVGVLIAGAVYLKSSPEDAGVSDSEQILTSREVGEKVINFINQNILQGQALASLITTGEEKELYTIKFEVQGNEINSYATRDGRLLFLEGIELTEKNGELSESADYTIGGFLVSNEEVCEENGKPIIYFFGSETCPYCTWEHPIMEEVAAKFGDNISFHNNMDSQDDREIFNKYSASGGIPTLVLGCKYYRVGAGTQAGEELEAEYLTALICKLTGNQPDNVCSQVQDLINQIKNQ